MIAQVCGENVEKVCRGRMKRENDQYGYWVSKILASTKSHLFRTLRFFSVNFIFTTDFFGQLQFCSSTSRRFPPMKAMQSASGQCNRMDAAPLRRGTCMSEPPRSHLHRRCDTSSILHLFHTTARARHTARGTRVVSRLRCLCRQSTCSYRACYSYGLPVYCRRVCWWSYV